jgi:hypothetical protein
MANREAPQTTTLREAPRRGASGARSEACPIAVERQSLDAYSLPHDALALLTWLSRQPISPNDWEAIQAALRNGEI